MAVRLRLMRMGKKKQPTYRIVAADSRSPRDGRFLEIIGTYNPRTEPSSVKVDNAAALRWLHDGARPSEAVEKLLKISGAWESYATGAPLPVEDQPATGPPAADAATADDTGATEVARAEADVDGAETAEVDAAEVAPADDADEEGGS